MRRKAIPGDPRTNAASLDLAERLHVGARLENAEAEKVFWFRKVRFSALSCLRCTERA